MMKNIFILLIISFVTTIGFSQSKNFIDKPYIETSAKVDTLVSPDRIYLQILIKEEDTKGKISVEELENKMATTLRSLKIDLKKQLTLSDAASNFKKYFLKKQDILKSKVYQLVIYNAQDAGKVFVALENIGISNVNLIRTEYSKMDALKLALKSKAIVQAKKQAEALLKPLQQKLGNAIFISDVNGYNNYGYRERVMPVSVAYSKAKSDNFEPIDIEFKKMKFQSEVNVKFSIE